MPTCPLCHNQTDFHKTITVNPANFSERIDKFDILECDKCHLSVMNPWPDKKDLEEIYIKDNAWAGVRFDKKKTNPFYQKLEEIYQKYGNYYNFVAKICLEHAENRSDLDILDLGCSSGLVMKAFYDIDPKLRIEGIDISADAKEKAFPELKEKIIVGDFLKMNFTKKYDIITLNFLIEHLPNFMDFFLKAKALLKPNGIIFFSTPDIGSMKAQKERDKWFLINRVDAKMGHIVWFNDASIEKLSENLKMKIIFKKNRGELFPYFPEWLQEGLKKIFGTDPSGRRFIKYYPPRITYATFVDGMISEKIGYGDCTYVIMK